MQLINYTKLFFLFLMYGKLITSFDGKIIAPKKVFKPSVHMG
jgi:hypothetical protein